jgi:hypothetical protein
VPGKNDCEASFIPDFKSDLLRHGAPLHDIRNYTTTKGDLPFGNDDQLRATMASHVSDERGCSVTGGAARARIAFTTSLTSTIEISSATRPEEPHNLRSYPRRSKMKPIPRYPRYAMYVPFTIFPAAQDR